MRTRPERPRGGFTLIELLIVMTIIGLILGFILAAAYEGLRAAEVKATVALIAKLDAAVADRMDALLALSPDVEPGHAALAVTDPTGANIARGPQRAYIIALIDMLRAQMPDVFIHHTSSPIPDYPVNFAGTPLVIPINSTVLSTSSPYPAYVLPIGDGALRPGDRDLRRLVHRKGRVHQGLRDQPGRWLERHRPPGLQRHR